MARRRKKNGHATEDGDALAAEEAREERRASAGDNSGKSKKEVMAAHERLNRLEGVLETAKGKIQAEWKKLKEEGFNTKSLKRARKDLREDPLDAQMDLEDYMAYRDMLGVNDAVQAARQAEDREANEASVQAASIPTQEEIAEAHDEGLIAGKAARDKSENPYADGSPKFLSWNAGWTAGQRQNIGGTQPELAQA